MFATKFNIETMLFCFYRMMQHHLDCPSWRSLEIREGLCRYGFDFAQQVHYPSNPMQPGPIYFKTPRKCGVFGVMTEALPQTMMFFLDEAIETGKGANTVISLLDFFFEFEQYGLRETA